MTRSKFAGGVFAGLLLVDLAWTSACNTPVRDEGDRHLLLIVERGSLGFRIDEIHVVPLPLPATRMPRSLRWRAEIADAAGHVLFSDSIPESGVRRGAFANADGTTESAELRLDTFTFALRLPLVRDAAHIRFFDTSPHEPGGVLPLAPTEVELGVITYPAAVR